MADDGSAQGTTWPLPKFYFNIDLGDGKTQGFSEISGLESEVKPIEYRHGDSKVFSPIKMPGLRSVGNVTLKKGIFTKDSIFWDLVQRVAAQHHQAADGDHQPARREGLAEDDLDADQRLADQDHRHRSQIGQQRGGDRVARDRL